MTEKASYQTPTDLVVEELLWATAPIFAVVLFLAAIWFLTLSAPIGLILAGLALAIGVAAPSGQRSVAYRIALHEYKHDPDWD